MGAEVWLLEVRLYRGEVGQGGIRSSRRWRLSEVRKLFASEGADIVHMSTTHFGAYMTGELDKWGRVVKQVGIKAQ